VDLYVKCQCQVSAIMYENGNAFAGINFSSIAQRNKSHQLCQYVRRRLSGIAAGASSHSGFFLQNSSSQPCYKEVTTTRSQCHSSQPPSLLVWLAESKLSMQQGVGLGASSRSTLRQQRCWASCLVQWQCWRCVAGLGR
jgi:hypothetical protein